jgi:HKD family nuclease
LLNAFKLERGKKETRTSEGYRLISPKPNNEIQAQYISSLDKSDNKFDIVVAIITS